MKKIIALIVSCLFVFSVVGISFAQEKIESAPAPAKEEKKAVGKKHAKKVGHYVRGEVTAVDTAANTLAVKGKKGDISFTIDDKTRLPKGKTLADLKVGDKLTVKYTETDGKKVAASVSMKTAHHHKKKGVKPEEKKEEKK